jgi:hypothetical protein
MGFLSPRRRKAVIPEGWRTLGFKEFLNAFTVEQIGTASMFLTYDYRTGEKFVSSLRDGALTMAALTNLFMSCNKYAPQGLLHPWARIVSKIFSAMEEANLQPPTDDDYESWPVLVPEGFRLHVPR